MLWLHLKNMKVKALTGWLMEHYPLSFAENWDNVGLLVGDDEEQVTHVFLALDLTEAVLKEAIETGADMIVTHHPMIFSGMKKINNHDFVGRKVIGLIKNHIQYYAMHTNFDVLGLAELSADWMQLKDRQVLSVTEEGKNGPEGIGRVGLLPQKITLRKCAELVKEALHLKDIRVYGDLDAEVEKAAVCTGSGKSLLKDALASGADVYVTGDVDHHTALDALDQGLFMIDAGHYGTEYIFMEAMKKELETAFPDLKISCAAFTSPYTML